VDGVVDLVMEEADGSLTIIDYKTDVAVTTDTVDEYLLQLCAYAELLGGPTGRPVGRIELVFCRGARPTVVARDLG
jgi:ATP-dependent helicase/nuclease subunit A